MINIIGVRVLRPFVLELDFSDGTRGVHDFAAIREKSGAMAEPLKDADYITRVFIEDGVITWPNGYDWDPIALHSEMKTGGQLRRVDAAK
jgi:hypothetical protein